MVDLSALGERTLWLTAMSSGRRWHAHHQYYGRFCGYVRRVTPFSGRKFAAAITGKDFLATSVGLKDGIALLISTMKRTDDRCRYERSDDWCGKTGSTGIGEEATFLGKS